MLELARMCFLEILFGGRARLPESLSVVGIGLLIVLNCISCFLMLFGLRGWVRMISCEFSLRKLFKKCCCWPLELCYRKSVAVFFLYLVPLFEIFCFFEALNFCIEFLPCIFCIVS